jgi:CheY-like chemotaxis protein
MTGARTLIVDDNEGMRLVARTLLEDSGHTVVGEACDGDEAVECARECRPELVLMDLRMPGTDGVEATGRIKAVLPDTTVVAWTSVADGEAAQRFYAAGASAFVVKHDLGGLERAIGRALDQRTTAPAP